MDETAAARMARSKKERTVLWLVANAEKIAAILLFLWCLLPVFMSGHALVMGAFGAFPTADEFPEGVRPDSFVYNTELATYYRAFCALGAATLLFAALSAALCRARIWAKESVKRQPYFYLLALLLLWAAVSACLADDPLYAFLGGSDKHDSLLSYFFYAGVFLCASMITAEKRRRFLLLTFCAAVAWLSAILLLQQTGSPFLAYCFPTRRAVVFNNSNHFGYVLCIAVAVTAGMYFYDRDTGRLRKPLCLLLLGLFTATLLVNRTFGAWLGAAVGLAAAYVFYFRRGGKWRWQLVLPGALFAALSALNAFGLFSSGASVASDIRRTVTDVQSIAAGVAEADRAGSGRWILWKQTLRNIAERPLFGFGPEGFYGEHALNSRNFTPHNEYLQMAGYLGIPALLLYLAALLALAVRQWKRLRELPPLVTAAACATVAYLSSAFVGNPVFNTAPYFWLFLGLTTCSAEAPLLSLEAAGTAEQLLAETEKKSSVRKIVPIAVVLALLVGGAGAYLSHREEKASELSDLQAMRAAEKLAEARIREKTSEEPERYWYAAGLSLIPDSEPTPAPCGMGTRRRGRTLASFEAEYGTCAYDERQDYRDKFLQVTITPGPDGSAQIQVDWVASAAE